METVLQQFDPFLKKKKTPDEMRKNVQNRWKIYCVDLKLTEDLRQLNSLIAIPYSAGNNLYTRRKKQGTQLFKLLLFDEKNVETQ